MKKKGLFLIIIVIFSISCSNKKVQNDSMKNMDDVFVAENCLTKEINSLIVSYIDDTKYSFMTNTKLYYNLYFSENNNMSYFTIWVFTSIPYKYLDNNSYLYNYQNINDYDVFLIKNKTTKLPAEIKFEFKKANEIKINIRKEEKYTNYDGSWFLQTYRYLPENDIIIRQDSLITDFLGKDAPIYMIKDNREVKN